MRKNDPDWVQERALWSCQRWGFTGECPDCSGECECYCTCRYYEDSPEPPEGAEDLDNERVKKLAAKVEASYAKLGVLHLMATARSLNY